MPPRDRRRVALRRASAPGTRPNATRAGGQARDFPDVCQVPATPGPPIPVPFPDIAMLTQADGSTCSQRVRVHNQPVVTVESEIPPVPGIRGRQLRMRTLPQASQRTETLWRCGSPITFTQCCTCSLAVSSCGAQALTM